MLKEYKQEQQEKLLSDQEKYAEDVKKQQQKFYSDVEDYITNLKDIRGVSISQREKKNLLDEIGRAHVWTPVTQWSRMPSSAWKKKKTQN